MCAEISRDFPRQVYEISVSDGPLGQTVILAAQARRGLKNGRLPESTEVQTLGTVCTTRVERRPAMPTHCVLTCVILSERGIYGSLPRKRRRLEYLAAYLCFR